MAFVMTRANTGQHSLSAGGCSKRFTDINFNICIKYLGTAGIPISQMKRLAYTEITKLVGGGIGTCALLAPEPVLSTTIRCCLSGQSRPGGPGSSAGWGLRMARKMDVNYSPVAKTP